MSDDDTDRAAPPAVPPRAVPRAVTVRRGPRALAASLPPITAPIFKKRGFAEAGILTDWPAIVGPLLAGRTAPERIAFPRGARHDGTLHIVCDGAFAPELQHLAPKVIERINGYFGYRAVARLKLIQGPVPKPPARPATPPRALAPAEEEALARCLATVADPDLRARLDALGRAVLGRNPAQGAGEDT